MRRALLICLGLVMVGVVTVRAQSDVWVLQHYTGKGMIAVPCLATGDQIGVVFDPPAGAFPIEITEIDIGWSSMFRTHLTTTAEAIRVYAGGVPGAAPALFTWNLPSLIDGELNIFNLDPMPGPVRVASGPFVVTLAVGSRLSGDAYFPGAAHDGYNPQPGRNLLYTPAQGWRDAPSAGITGDWIVRIAYRSLNGVVARMTPNNLAFGGSDQATVYIHSDGTQTLRIDGITGGIGLPASVDTTGTSHIVAPGDSTAMHVSIRPNTSNGFTTTFRVYSNAKNSPTVLSVQYTATVPSGVPNLKEEFRITSVVPNPFNPITTIHYALPEASVVDADVFAVNGAHVRALERAVLESAGTHALVWDGRDDTGSVAASGIYFFRLQSRLGTRVTRLVLLK